MNELTKFTKIAAKCKNERDVTRLWNYADYQTDTCELLWAILLTGCPFAFDDPAKVNSIRFTY